MKYAYIWSLRFNILEHEYTIHFRWKICFIKLWSRLHVEINYISRYSNNNHCYLFPMMLYSDISKSGTTYHVGAIANNFHIYGIAPKDRNDRSMWFRAYFLLLLSMGRKMKQFTSLFKCVHIFSYFMDSNLLHFIWIYSRAHTHKLLLGSCKTGIEDAKRADNISKPASVHVFW